MGKINIAELLKDCPKGMELDCALYDKTVQFDGIEKGEVELPIRVKIEGDCEWFDRYGRYNTRPYSKCVIFPKGKTTWEGFVPPIEFKDSGTWTIKDAKDGDVLFHSDSASSGIFIFKEISQRGTLQKVICYCDYDSEDGFCLGENHTCCWTDSKILHPATKEQCNLLFQKIKEAGYKWDAETKTLMKLVEPKFKIGDMIQYKGTDYKPIHLVEGIVTDRYILDNDSYIKFGDEDSYILLTKFDINTLISFESRVLVRDNETHPWTPAIWGFYDELLDGNNYVVEGGNGFNMCIPFEGNEHLIGKRDDCNEIYKTWEE